MRTQLKRACRSCASKAPRSASQQRFVAQLESKPGQLFDAAKAERDARRLAATGDYLRADYTLVHGPDGDGLVFDVEDKPWGPHYFRIGLDLSTDFRGGGGFNVKISHNRHWLDANGSEWRNRVQIGQAPGWFTEIYHPLNWTVGASNDWFLAGYGEVARRTVTVYDNDSGAKLARFERGLARVGVDLGQPWGEFGELRAGLTHVVQRVEPDILSAGFPVVTGAITERETGLRLATVIDQLDFANFPQRGFRVKGEAVTGHRTLSLTTERERFTRIEGDATLVGTWQRDTLNAYVRAQKAASTGTGGIGRYTLGGFHQLSGYEPEQLNGSAVLFGRLTWYRRSSQVPLFTRGLFVGATLEAGNAWAQASEVNLGDLRTGTSLFVGADTGLGPVYFGLTHAPRGSTGLYLFIGRP